MHYYHHPDCRLHRTPPGHPERVERVEALEHFFKGNPKFSHLNWRTAEEAPEAALELVHEGRYLESLEKHCGEAGEEREALDGGDTWAVGDSWRVARLGAGAGLEAVDAVLSGETKRAFIGMRPPGHHARPGEAMGFCLLGNVAIAARHAQAAHGVKRVFILDWDVHHGNGTQEIFYADPSVFFFSLHESPHWPFSGREDEIGRGAGAGTTRNVEIPSGSDCGVYAEAFEGPLRGAIAGFKPDLLLISAGFDAHRLDPLSSIRLTGGDFGQLTERVCDFAAEVCEGRIVSFLEGGYSLEGLTESVAAHLRVLSAY